jgi:hypothetical protein
VKVASALVPLVASVLIAGAIFCTKNHRSESSRVVEVSLDAPYLRVVAAMGKKSSFEKILESGGARLVERTWDDFKFDLREMPRLASWEMRGKGRFRVVSESKEFPGEMELDQEMRADRKGVLVDSSLSRPCGFVKEYETTTSIRNSHPPVLRIENKIVYQRSIPFWMAKDVDARVDAYNDQKVQAIIGAIRSIVHGDHAEKTAHQ